MKQRPIKKTVTVSDRLKKISEDIEDIETLDDQPDEIRYVRTIFPSFNRAIVLGGAPLGCTYAVHGPFQEGKSTFCAGLARSFQETGNIAVYIDAEHGVSKKWLKQLGVDPKSLIYKRPDFLEDTADMIDQLIANFDELKETDPNVGMAIFVDSLNKLTPKSEFEKFIKDGASVLDQGLARTRALLLTSWLDHITPIIGKRDIALVFIAQERRQQKKNLWDKEYKVKGLQAVMYDCSVRFRIQFGRKISTGSKENKKVIGQAHNIWVFKNRVGYPNERGTFYTSNGKGNIPIGFDIQREILDESVTEGIIKKAGAWYSFQNEKLGQGEEQAVKFIYSNKHIEQEILKQLYERRSND